MAVNVVHIDRTPAQVFAVLSDGWTYSNWVVGTSHMRAVEQGWPQPGSHLHHAAGAWPFVRRDNTVVEAMEPNRSLTLTARGRPFGEAKIVMDLEAEDGGTRVTMTETPTAGPGAWLHNPVADSLLARRNNEALARLRALAERRDSPAS